MMTAPTQQIQAYHNWEEMTEALKEQPKLGPQPGPQELFLRCPADIAIYGGAAGGGKSYAALLEPLYHINNPGFEAILFRRIYRQITAPGGLWDRSMEIYPQVGGKPHFSAMQWIFPSGARVRFSHMQYDADCVSWKGSEITLILFDELTDFSEYQFWYMLSRNRSLSGIKPYLRACTNPDSESWVRALLAPWVDPTYPNPAKSGEIRWFVRVNGQLEWCEPERPFAKSLTFIAANIFDNKILLEKDPAYLANLHALPEIERQRLLLGNWTIRPSGNKFKREWFPIVDTTPPDITQKVRFWDLAATEEIDELTQMKRSRKDGADYTAGVLIGLTASNTYVILDAQWFRKSPKGIDEAIRATAENDGIDTTIYIEEEPGASGKHTTDHYRRFVLPGFDFHAIRQTGSKILRANIVASMCEGRLISMLRAWWNDPMLNFLTAFPNERVHDDVPDAFFSAMMVLFSAAHEVAISVTNTPYKSAGHSLEYKSNDTELASLPERQYQAARILQQVRQLYPSTRGGEEWIG